MAGCGGSPVKGRQRVERLMQAVFWLCACAAVAAVVLICVFLFSGGAPALREIGVWQFLTGVRWEPGRERFGVLPMIAGSLAVTLGAVLLGVPVGLLTAVFLRFFCPLRARRVLGAAVGLLAGIPSVVYGFFGLTVLVPAVRRVFGGSGYSVLAVSLVLGMMILPTVVSVSADALAAVEAGYYEGARALGAGHERSVFRVLLPAARSGISAAVILGLGRAIGESMAVVMVAGNQAVFPHSPLDGARTLTSNIVLEMGYASGLHADALIATGVVLFAMVMLNNLIFALLRRRRMKK